MAPPTILAETSQCLGMRSVLALPVSGHAPEVDEHVLEQTQVIRFRTRDIRYPSLFALTDGYAARAVYCVGKAETLSD